MKTSILYIIGIFISYRILRDMLDKNIINNYQCFITSLFWIIILPLGIIMSIIELIRQSIKAYKRKGERRNVLEETKTDRDINKTE